MRIEIKPGYNNPSIEENVIVELETGMLTGAHYMPEGLNLWDSNCFLNSDDKNFNYNVVAWYPSMVQKIKESSI